MKTMLKANKEYYSEIETAEALGISTARLHFLLDQNVFNDGSPKPQTLNFRITDIVMMELWEQNTPEAKVLAMPKQAAAANA